MATASRRDKRGRRIGYNWWREMNCQIVNDYNDGIYALAETNHQMEPAEFRAAYPLLTLKAALIQNAGMHREEASGAEKKARRPANTPGAQPGETDADPPPTARTPDTPGAGPG